MQQLDCYMFVVELVAQLALDDFGGLMPDRMSQFSNLRYPTIVAAAACTVPGSRLPRRYILWSLASIMDDLVSHGFEGGNYEIQWQGRKVGQFLMTSRSMDSSSFNSIALASSRSANESQMVQVAESKNQTDNSSNTASVGNAHFTQSYDFFGILMSPADVFMGTIGAIISAASDTDEYFDAFFGGWGGETGVYSTVHTYQAVRRPSTFSKALLVRTMLNAASEAYARTDFRELNTRIGNGAGTIATGGYVDFPPPRSREASGGRANVTSS